MNAQTHCGHKDLRRRPRAKTLGSLQIFSVCGLPEIEVWDHLNGTVSAPFEATPETKVAVKVVDTRGNELMVVKTVGEAIG